MAECVCVGQWRLVVEMLQQMDVMLWATNAHVEVWQNVLAERHVC